MDDVRDAVMTRAALDYLELAKVRHALELMRSERLSASHILDATRDRAATGRELPVEVIRAQLTTARIEQRIAQLEDRDDSLSGELRDMMGLPSDESIEVSTEEIPGAAAEASKDVVAEAMANNLELKVAQTELRAREFKLKGEQGGRWPTFAFTGQYNVLSKINNYNAYFNRFSRNNVIFGVAGADSDFCLAHVVRSSLRAGGSERRDAGAAEKTQRTVPGRSPQGPPRSRSGTRRGSGAAGAATGAGKCARAAGAV